MHASGSSSRAAAVKVLTRSPEYSGLCICWSADFPVRRGRLFAVDLALAFAFASVRGAFGSLLAAADLAFAFAFALGIFLGILELALAVVLALRGRLVCGAPSNSTLLFSCSKVAFEGEQSWRIFLLRLTRFAALLLRVFFVFFPLLLFFPFAFLVCFIFSCSFLVRILGSGALLSGLSRTSRLSTLSSPPAALANGCDVVDFLVGLSAIFHLYIYKLRDSQVI